MLFLTVALCSVYLQVKDHQFINFDDFRYVTENSHVLSGLNLENIKWAFSFSNQEVYYWHPLTWISHMADIQLWGVNSGKHHLSNLFIHIINTLILFFTLRKMTGDLWKSAFVAALFALHPINVDTVAWVAERKNLLSTSFWFLVMLTYCLYVKRPSLFRYMFVAISFIMGLLAKPMLVTLPFVLLLLDYWPLKRISIPTGYSEGLTCVHDYPLQKLINILKSRVFYEKIPLILIAFISIHISTLSLKIDRNIISTKQVPMDLRISNALVSYIKYIQKIVWPHDLAIYYPFPASIPTWQIAGSVIIIVSISVAVLRAYRSHPFLFVGWSWYLGTLVPVSGLYQAGLWPAMADRWAYIPSIGIFIIIAWGLPELLDKWQFKKIALVILTGIVIPILIVCSWMQVGYWKNTITLFEHATKVTENNALANTDLGAALMDKGDLDSAIIHFNEALRIKPHDYLARIDLAKALLDKGDLDSAMIHCNEAIKDNPNYAYNYNVMGLILKRKGEMLKAVYYYSKAIQLESNYFNAYNNLGVAYVDLHRFNDAIRQFSKVIELDPKNDVAFVHLGVCLIYQGRLNEAIQQFHKALQINPNSLEAHYNLGIALMSQGKKDEAIDQFKLVLIIDPGNIQAQKILSMLLSSRNK